MSIDYRIKWKCVYEKREWTETKTPIWNADPQNGIKLESPTPQTKKI